MPKFNYQLLLSLILLIGFFNATNARANDELTKTQAQLSALGKKIKILEKKLYKAENKKQFLNQELASNEKKIAIYQAKVHTIEKNIATKQEEIHNLRQEISELEHNLDQAKLQISAYLVAKYKTSQQNKLQIFLQQSDWQSLDKTLHYYNHLINANHKILAEFKQNQQQLANKNRQLQTELQTISNLKQRTIKYLATLHDDKVYQNVLMTKLTTDIANKQQTLKKYKKSQLSLSKLVNKLTKQSVLQSKVSLQKIQGKLTQPVNVTKKSKQKMNQGLVFYADEGQDVSAVAAGKVVFADWLNGYGLLLIIDHGWGFMTLYGNNLALTKAVGNNVHSGEKIAKIGHSGVLPENGLYFEIRHHGKALPPKKWLQH